jgi:hypothetical protein
MTEKQPNFFYKIEETGRINSLGDEFKQAFTPDLPQQRQTTDNIK